MMMVKMVVKPYNKKGVKEISLVIDWINRRDVPEGLMVCRY